MLLSDLRSPTLTPTYMSILLRPRPLPCILDHCPNVSRLGPPSAHPRPTFLGSHVHVGRPPLVSTYAPPTSSAKLGPARPPARPVGRGVKLPLSS